MEEIDDIISRAAFIANRFREIISHGSWPPPTVNARYQVGSAFMDIREMAVALDGLLSQLKVLTQ